MRAGSLPRKYWIRILTGGGLKKKIIGFDDIIGQGAAVRILKRMLARGRVPHALLFTGIDGTGRQTTAKALAMALNCRARHSGKACRRCDACRKMISFNHPDLMVIEPSGVTIKIDQIRSLRKQLRYAPVEGGFRIIILNDAQTMNLEASNAMLKMLEEPPDNTHIILTAPEPSDLLATIVSRCQQVAFRPISPNSIDTFLQQEKGMDGATARAMAVLSKGSLGAALCADAAVSMARREALMGQLVSMSEASIPALFGLAEELSRGKEELQETLDMMLTWFRDVLVWKWCPENILNTDHAVHIEEASEKRSEDDLLNIIAVVSSTQQKISKNANRRLALEVLLMTLGDVAARP
jgi:DNA polymerase-3 subunit delta'